MKNILIIKTGSIGDVLRTTCVIEGLIEKFFNPRIYWLTSIKSLPVIETNPFLSKIFLIEHLDKEIYKLEFDMVISLEEDIKCLEVLSGLKKRIIFGIYSKNGIVDYTAKSSYWYNMSLISKFGKEVWAGVGKDSLKKSNIFSYPEILYKMLDLRWNKQKPRLYLKDDIKKYSLYKADKLDLKKTIIGIVIGAGERWPLKVLPADLQIKLIKKMNKEFGGKVEFILITGPSKLEMGNAKEILKKCPFVKSHEIVNLDELFGIISFCDIIVTPDTLSMHIAISLNKYIVAYFTVTSASEIEIYLGEKIMTSDKNYYCSYFTENLPRPNCADKISLDEIVDAVKKAIK